MIGMAYGLKKLEMMVTLVNYDEFKYLSIPMLMFQMPSTCVPTSQLTCQALDIG